MPHRFFAASETLEEAHDVPNVSRMPLIHLLAVVATPRIFRHSLGLIPRCLVTRPDVEPSLPKDPWSRARPAASLYRSAPCTFLVGGDFSFFCGSRPLSRNRPSCRQSIRSICWFFFAVAWHRCPVLLLITCHFGSFSALHCLGSEKCGSGTAAVR